MLQQTPKKITKQFAISVLQHYHEALTNLVGVDDAELIAELRLMVA